MTAPDRAAPVETAVNEPLTIAQIAERAGVSLATVSKVVNGRADVSAETRSLVESVIRRHGYRRRKRPAGPAPLLELVLHAVEGPYPVEVFRGVQRVAREHGLAVVLSELEGHHTPGRGWVEDVLARRPTGVISVFSSPSDDQGDRLRSRGIPFVLVDPTGEPAHACPSVGASNWNGGLSAVRHLLELGHHRIAVITGPEHILSSRARLDGYRAGLEMAGLAVDPELIRVGDFHIESGLRHTRDLLRLPDPPTAVFACNDGQALGVYLAAAEAGVRIPQDLSVVGFDDLFPSAWTPPPLTTVRQPLAEMAATAATMVLALSREEPLPQRRVEMATELVVRGSTAPPRS
ncbi:LacI family DNA-binding transcriptional regulator [Allostreptomyces psammosilenae]|uniref:DNA-binding LacI/PurR family transcriptional regulator n=1 Tax=Allostreptomyces psammosilenae TaxID=1892865 RepID=A0A852ZTL1_9ACTN|nr:LacI family DNA-binding transcriptional regulator [Allostreptomyces psammosilenae]NYI04620.1 DNA-binding LacI/PurR family transcriptional regulator [Allostreptomyces psammosilenae]